jgi:hypothetical protein
VLDHTRRTPPPPSLQAPRNFWELTLVAAMRRGEEEGAAKARVWCCVSHLTRDDVGLELRFLTRHMKYIYVGYMIDVLRSGITTNSNKT